MEKDIVQALEYEHRGEAFYFGLYNGKKDLKAAREMFVLAAQYGIGEVRADALCNLALLTEDPDQKEMLYMEAAEEDCAHAMNMIGIGILRKRWYGYYNAYDAEKWFRRAADAGSVCGMYNYAMQTKDLRKRKKYLEKAASLGDQRSLERLEEMRREEERKQAEVEERVKPYMKSALANPEKPVAFIPIRKLSENAQSQLVYEIAAVAKRSVILLIKDSDPDLKLRCVGYDYGRVGLPDAMQNQYIDGSLWNIGHFSIGKIHAKDRKVYCHEVELKLMEMQSEESFPK